MDSRLQRLRAAMTEAGVDAYVIRHVADLHWLTGFQRVFDSECAHLALVTQEGAWLHTDSRYSAAMRQRNEAQGVWEISDEAVGVYTWLVGLLAQHAPDAEVGIEDDLPLNRARALQKALAEKGMGDMGIMEIESPILSLRAVKDEEELQLLQRAQDITDQGFSQVLEIIQLGMTEKELGFELEVLLRRAGADALSFPSIIASGPNGANPHAVVSDRVLEKGDMVVMDFGVVLDGYCSDMTRTICIGQPDEEQLRAYSTVLEANRRCNQAIRPGEDLASIHNLAASIIDEGGFAGTFRHALGHGVGLEVHESPTFSPKAEGQLEVGNVVTVEPGIYLEGRFGIRIENYGVVEDGGFRSFTHSPDELICI